VYGTNGTFESINTLGNNLKRLNDLVGKDRVWVYLVDDGIWGRRSDENLTQRKKRRGRWGPRLGFHTTGGRDHRSLRSAVWEELLVLQV